MKNVLKYIKEVFVLRYIPALSTGDISVYPLDGVRMEVSSWEDGGDNDLGRGEGLCSSLCYSLHRLCYPPLL